jgi:phosphoglycerate dehydrogenase-like enzyme
LPEGVDEPPIGPELRDVLARAEVALAIDLPDDILTLAPRLRWVQSVGAGTGQLRVDNLATRNVVLTNNGGANGVGIAEFVIGRIIAWAKQFDKIDELQAEHRWEPLYGRELTGMTVGLIGYGGINENVATRLAPFGVNVVVLRNTEGLAPEPPVRRYYAHRELHEFLGACDIVVAAVPETDQTRNMFDDAAFGAMRPGAYFVNVGRGTLVDQAALARALESGHLSGAALDVTQPEPLPADDPLWGAPNLKISPHCSSAPQAMFPHVHENMRANLSRYLAGEPLRSVVRPGRGY